MQINYLTVALKHVLFVRLPFNWEVFKYYEVMCFVYRYVPLTNPLNVLKGHDQSRPVAVLGYMNSLIMMTQAPY